ncbi:unnamed protein product [Darwinula stevensoni]|uniref:Uncharacterized protein n=1 Tax=Darwinula stevensoni TaxID=69355 RepID=A0A7R9A227_9CRUS|nr:unnamed protein product [Darwinula stevensoni]CAG0884806.1 unnamed protein product [Darwinula stevensoni]
MKPLFVALGCLFAFVLSGHSHKSYKYRNVRNYKGLKREPIHKKVPISHGTEVEPSHGGTPVHIPNVVSPLKQPEPDLLNFVISVNGKHNGYYQADKQWNVDCNQDHYSYTYGYITAVWDDKDKFADVDKVKCSGNRNAYGGIKLDTHDNVVIHLSRMDPYFKPYCPKNYVLTGIYDTHYGFQHLVNGKCTRVKYGYVDNEKCIEIETDYKSGGTYDPNQSWKVECPPYHGAVGLLRNYDKITALKCCQLVRHDHHDTQSQVHSHL